MPTTPPGDSHAEPSDLLRWQAEEAAVRARLAPAGVARPGQVAGLSGVEVMQAMLDGRLPSPHIGHQMHFVLIRVEPVSVWRSHLAPGGATRDDGVHLS